MKQNYNMFSEIHKHTHTHIYQQSAAQPRLHSTAACWKLHSENTPH